MNASSLPNANDDDTAIGEDRIVESNVATAGHLEIRRTLDGRGWGIVALRSYAVGDIVMRGRTRAYLPTKTQHSIQIGWDCHVLMDLPAVLVNHACPGSSNVGIRWNNNNNNKHSPTLSQLSWLSLDFVALRDLNVGDELLWDYETSEYELSSPFECHCGSAQCGHYVRGYKWHSHNVLSAYGHSFVAPYLLLEEEKNETAPKAREEKGGTTTTMTRSSTPPSVVHMAEVD